MRNNGQNFDIRNRPGLTGALAATLALAGLAAPMPARAQFGGLFSGSKKAGDKTTDGCSKGKSRSVGSQIAGGVLGSIAGGAASRVGGVFNFVPIAGLTDQLTAAIACKLDPDEQKQAAQATLDATRGAGDDADVAVGSSSSWMSTTREGVSGSSTVTGRDDDAGGGEQCITVSDVVIVMGEETRANKRMCRNPPAVRYALVA